MKGSTLKGVCVWHSALGISLTARAPSGAPGMCLCGAAAAGRYGKQRSEENQAAVDPQAGDRLVWVAKKSWPVCAGLSCLGSHHLLALLASLGRRLLLLLAAAHGKARGEEAVHGGYQPSA